MRYLVPLLSLLALAGCTSDLPTGASSGGTTLATVVSCLTQAGPLTTLSGAQTVSYDNRHTSVVNQKVDARTATWSRLNAFPINVGVQPGFCWSGGVVTGAWDEATTTWNTYHGAAGFISNAQSATIENFRVTNHGDGLRLADTTAKSLVDHPTTIRDAKVTSAHDDCFENDRLFSGTIENSFFNGCYTLVSEKPAGSIIIDSTNDARNRTLTIRNSIFWQKAYNFPEGCNLGAPPPCTASLFKFPPPVTEKKYLATKVVLDHVVIRVDQLPSNGDLNSPWPDSLSARLTCMGNDTLVWLGPGAFPGQWPGCGLVVTTNIAVWNNAVAAWNAGHP
jgi:hypothetical protein